MRKRSISPFRSIFNCPNLIFKCMPPKTQLCIQRLNPTPSHTTCMTAEWEQAGNHCSPRVEQTACHMLKGLNEVTRVLPLSPSVGIQLCTSDVTENIPDTTYGLRFSCCLFPLIPVPNQGKKVICRLLHAGWEGWPGGNYSSCEWVLWTGAI